MEKLVITTQMVSRWPKDFILKGKKLAYGFTKMKKEK